MSYLFTLNNIRYEEKKAVINEPGVQLIKRNSQNKPVLIVGEYEISDLVMEQIYPDQNRLRYKMSKAMNDFMGIIYPPHMKKEFNPKAPNTNIQSVMN